MEHRHIFIGGIHRSGTTPLARTLGAHPQISGLAGTGAPEDEGQHIQDVYPKIRAYGGMSRFAFASDANLTESSPLANADSRSRLLRAWSPYWDMTSPFLLEKSPSNLITTRFLQAVFPNSWFIVVVRHPVIASLAVQKWNPRFVAKNGRRHTSLAQTVRHWDLAHSILRSDAHHIRHLHILRYEDLVADPDAALNRIRVFLGLDHPIDSSLISQGHDEKYIRAWREMEHGSLFARRQRTAVIRMRLPEATAFGYDVNSLKI